MPHLFLAFAAGLLSFLSPCVLPLVPVYLTYMSGSSLAGDSWPSRRQVFIHALCFLMGLTLVVVVLFGLPATLLAGLLRQYGDLIARIGGVILILFGLHALGIITVPIFNATRRAEVGAGMSPGYVRSTLLGLAFAAGWTPCIGPLLGTVVIRALTEPGRALSLLLAYALGLAVPFLIIAALLAQAVDWLKRFGQNLWVVEMVSGLLMIGTGVWAILSR
jgi:cytochrome c-type biogenesis protein